MPKPVEVTIIAHVPIISVSLFKIMSYIVTGIFPAVPLQTQQPHPSMLQSWLPISTLVSGHDVIKLLSVPELHDGTAVTMSHAMVDSIHE